MNAVFTYAEFSLISHIIFYYSVSRIINSEMKKYLL